MLERSLRARMRGSLYSEGQAAVSQGMEVVTWLCAAGKDDHQLRMEKGGYRC